MALGRGENNTVPQRVQRAVALGPSSWHWCSASHWGQATRVAGSGCGVFIPAKIEKKPPGVKDFVTQMPEFCGFACLGLPIFGRWRVAPVAWA